MNKWILLFVTLIRSFSISGSDSTITVSVLTLDPGQEIYTIFGHTAIRITNTPGATDRVYNFGTFDFDDPWFYAKFIKGNLEYFLSVTSYDQFMLSAYLEKRTVHEQQLKLSSSEAEAMEKELQRLYHSPERYYQYDFFEDNCATRVRNQIFDPEAIPPDSTIHSTTFRHLLKPFIVNRYWLNLGINLALGNKADDPAREWESMFLPVYISKMIDKTGLEKSRRLLLKASEEDFKVIHSKFWPWIIFMVIAISQIFRRTRKLAFFLFFLSLSLTAFILLMVSIISENPALSCNLNLIWLLPSIFVLIASSLRYGNMIKLAYLILIVILLIAWNHLPRGFSSTFIPWMAAIILLLAVDISNQRLSI